ncbi:MAG: 6-hydroxymethylpterin diphosphokinase MptE-like protein [Thermodesulfobacteriota bacterium]
MEVVAASACREESGTGGGKRYGHPDILAANLESLARHRQPLWKMVREKGGAGGDAGDVTRHWSGVAGHLDTVPAGASGLVVFLGMGSGQGPLLLLGERPELAQFAILEPSVDVFTAAMACLDLRPLFEDPRVLFFVGEIDWDGFGEEVYRVASLEDTHILRHLPSFNWRPALYGALNDKAYMLLNQINASGSTTRQWGPVFMENRLANLTTLRHANTLDDLRDLFAGRPAVLVAAGPSLAKSIPELRRLVGHSVLIAADSALAPLLQAGIVPDFVTSIDYLDLNFEKVAPYLDREWPFSLVTLIKACPLVVKRLPARHLFFAFAEDLPHQWIVEALGIRMFAPACSSVAHLSLGCALIMGCDPIIFVGQDLGYTDAADDHAAGTIIMRRELPRDREILRIPAVGGGQLPTDRQFLSLLKLFEDIIEGWPRHYVNATAAGARIRGTAELPLAEAARRHIGAPLAVGAKVEAACGGVAASRVASLVDGAGRNLEMAAAKRRQLREAVELGQAAEEQLAALAKRGKGMAGFQALPVPLQRLLARYDELNRAIDHDDGIWTQVIELTFGMLSDNDRCRTGNDRLRGREGYLPWTRAEIGRINHLNRERLAVLDRYAEGLEGLCRHLDAEGRLLAGKRPSVSELVSLYLAAGDYLLARREQARQATPATPAPDWLLHAGAIRAGMLDIAGADAAWRQAAAAAPEMAEEISGLRQRFAGEWTGFVQRYGNAGEGKDNFPHLLPIWVERVMGLMGERRAAAALLGAFFEGQAPRLAELLAGGEQTEAADVLRAWQALAPDAPSLHASIARYHACRGELVAAVAAMEQALAAEPANLDWLCFAVRTLLAAGRYAEAVDRLGRAVRANPQAGALWEEFGDLLMAAGDLQAAAMAYTHCRNALPDRKSAGRKLEACRMGNPSLPVVPSGDEEKK